MYGRQIQPLELQVSSASTNTTLGTEFEHRSDWITANHAAT